MPAAIVEIHLRLMSKTTKVASIALMYAANIAAYGKMLIRIIESR